MLKLKNVSKFYYSNGVVSSGFTKVNLELKKGEFVAITGESGSGKSTLLNVISGLDTYEEGEMYINGEETSAYGSEDFENYRRKYIANIYQSFNLINSYTVWQNVEMVLLLSGLKPKERKAKIKDILQKVDLYKFRNTRASRLSGGQKQRVAIARALVKDTPIIVADEPTGNLDSESAANVIELLAQLASDRLVVVVTHNYEQVEPYVTRKITMHDGRVIEDLVLKNSEDISEGIPEDTSKAVVEAESTAGLSAEPEAPAAKAVSDEESFIDPDIKAKRKRHLKLFARIKLGVRNTFNIVPKFVLLLFIFFFVSAAVTALYSNMRQSSYYSDLDGYNYFFNNLDEKRIVIKKSDRSPITSEDFEALENLKNVDYIFKDDILLDCNVDLEIKETDNEYWFYFYGSMGSLSVYDFESNPINYGRMPENEDEVVVVLPIQHYYNSEDMAPEILNSEYYMYINGNFMERKTFKVSGIVFEDMGGSWEEKILAGPELFDLAKSAINKSYSTVTIKAAGQEFESTEWNYYNKIVPSSAIKKGYALVSSDWHFLYDSQWAIGNTLTIKAENLYYTDSKTLTIGNVYYQWNFKEMTGYSDYNMYNGLIFVNSEDYNSLFDKDNFQSSIFIKDTDKVADTLEDLEEMGYEPLRIKDAMKHYNSNWMVVDEIFNKLWSSALVVGLFFVVYFIIKLILKSRNVYFATIRMLGASAPDCKSLIRIDLFLVMNLAFLLMLGALYAAHLGYYEFDFISTILEYLRVKDYAILYGVLAAMSLIISQRYSRQLFKTSAMNVYKEV